MSGKLTDYIFPKLLVNSELVYFDAEHRDGKWIVSLL
jgi:hypothetical protein